MLYKTLFVLSIIAVLAGLVFVGSGGGPNFPFNPQIPNFNDPNIVQQTVNDWTVTATNATNTTNGFGSFFYNTPNATFGTGHGCSLADYWNCINDPNGPDDNTSLTRLLGTQELSYPFSHFYDLVVNLSVPQPFRYVTQLVIEIHCNSPYPQTPFPIATFIQTWGINVAISHSSMKCSNPQNSHFPVSTAQYNLSVNFGHYIDLNNLPDFLHNQFYFYLQTDIGTPNHSIVNITYIVVHATYVDKVNTACGSTDAFCQLGTVLTWSIGNINFFFQLAWWLILLLGNILQLLVNYFSVIIWLYNIPGMPLQVQLFIDAVLTSWIVTLSVEIFKLIKPFGS